MWFDTCEGDEQNDEAHDVGAKQNGYIIKPN